MPARKLFHKTLATMLRPLRSLSNTGIHLYINDNIKWFYPYLALIISDWPEASLMCTIYGTPNSLRSCHFCLVDRNFLNNIHLEKENIIIHNENMTKDGLRQAEYQALMKTILFALDELIPEKKLNKSLCDLYSLWIDMYMWSCQTKYTKLDLNKFEASNLAEYLYVTRIKVSIKAQ
ncbi:15777_t:CDS:2 [Racocetra fulgida]|uniref:15777_t:CDS:1 n=1 Tax=Racocetra fulgida TaxID=60492 RepID=A0A9N9CBM6_9GLOM|nr:15777_t:CDS:2 [Racocetra fulgida]